MKWLLGLLGVAVSATGWAADGPAADKTGYTLFDPTPDQLLRDFAPDRPDQSTGPTTVDAGHVQIETGLWDGSFDGWSAGGITTRQINYGVTELRLGVTNRGELDVVAPGFQTQRVTDRASGRVQQVQGAGDLMLGGKVNLLGNEGGAVALGLSGFARVPTAAAGLSAGADGSVVAPLVLALPAKFGLTVQPGVALLHQTGGSPVDYQLIVTLDRPIIGDAVTAGVELVVDHAVARQVGNRHTADASLAWQIGRNVQLDAGVNVGLSKAATDVEPYVGVSWRP